MVRILSFLLALLLCFGAARAVDPTAVLTGTITPTGGGIACDYGPNFTGSIPAGATRAGFTHCAFNSDFTQMGPVSSWLGGGCGASDAAALWWNTGYNGPATPCSRFNIEFDAAAGSNVLHIVYTPADSTASGNTVMMTWMSTQNGSGFSNPGSKVISFPNGTYVQLVSRSNAQTQVAFPTTKGYDMLSFFSWSNLSTTDFWEFDIMEAFQEGNAGANFNRWNQGDSVAIGAGIPYFNNGTSFCPSQECAYHTYAMRVTDNPAAGMNECPYLDGVFIDCAGDNGYTGSAHTARNWFGLGVGQQNNVPTDASLNNMDFYIKSVLVLTCATWQTTQCTGPLLNNAP